PGTRGSSPTGRLEARPRGHGRPPAPAACASRARVRQSTGAFEAPSRRGGPIPRRPPSRSIHAPPWRSSPKRPLAPMGFSGRILRSGEGSGENALAVHGRAFPLTRPSLTGREEALVAFGPTPVASLFWG